MGKVAVPCASVTLYSFGLSATEVHGGRCGTLTRLPGVIYSLIRERHIQRLRLREHDGAVFGSPVMATSGYCTCRVVLVLRRANA